MRDDSESEGERDGRDAGESDVELRYCCLRTNCAEFPSFPHMLCCIRLAMIMIAENCEMTCNGERDWN